MNGLPKKFSVDSKGRAQICHYSVSPLYTSVRFTLNLCKSTHIHLELLQKTPMSGYLILYLLPRNLLSFVIGKLVLIKRPSILARFALGVFVKLTGISLVESEKGLKEFDCIGDLFVRRLREGVRPVTGKLVSPVDGIHRESDTISCGQIPQVKGRDYTVESLLADSEFAPRFAAGSFSNLYLSPRHYHRVHSPVSGSIVGWSYIPGTLWPVNDWSLHQIDQLFCINERFVTYIDTEFGLVAAVMVGATNVGKMTMSYIDVVTNQSPFRRHPPVHQQLAKPYSIVAGDELGVFHLGSTVVLLFEQEQKVALAGSVETLVGQSLL